MGCHMDRNERKRLGGAGGAFIASGLVFFILGVGGRTAFLGVGIALLVIGMAQIARARKEDRKDGAP